MSNAQASTQPSSRIGMFWTLNDTLLMAKRSILHIIRNLDQLMSLVLFPVMFMLLNRYVFGGAINTGDVSYDNYLFAGILVKVGIIDRFRSLPMANSALVTGHIMADLVRNFISALVIIPIGFLVGFRPSASLTDWLCVAGLGILFTLAISWLSAILGLLVKSLEAAQWVGFIVIFPLTFISSAFVPTNTMPAGLRAFAENQPLTQVINAMRSWLVGTPMNGAAWKSVVWLVSIIVISIPVTTWLFKRRALKG
jgi:ABC-2 type transport system permease protein